MSSQIVTAHKISDVPISNIILGVKKRNSKVIPISVNNNVITWQTPYLQVASEMKPTKMTDTNLLITLLQGESKKQVNKFYQFIEQFETHITKLVKDSGATWSTQKNLIMRSVIRDSGDEILYIEWPISMSATVFIDTNNKLFDTSGIQRNDLVKFIIETSFLWINENHFGLALIVKKVMVKKYICPIIKEYVFNNESDSSSEESEIDEPDNNGVISLLATENKTKYIKNIDKTNPTIKIQQQLALEAKKMIDTKHAYESDLINDEEISDQESSFDLQDDTQGFKRIDKGLCDLSDGDINEDDLEEDI
jgi:hypothetical protein